MKILITENQFYDVIDKYFKKRNIIYDILYFNDNGWDQITGTVYPYDGDGKIIGKRHGYDFTYTYDKRFKTLKYDGNNSPIENNRDFSIFPPGMVTKFFSDKVEDHLKNYIEKGYTTLNL
jgi:hypothetical protein